MAFLSRAPFKSRQHYKLPLGGKNAEIRTDRETERQRNRKKDRKTGSRKKDERQKDRKVESEGRRNAERKQAEKIPHFK